MENTLLVPNRYHEIEIGLGNPHAMDIINSEVWLLFFECIFKVEISQNTIRPMILIFWDHFFYIHIINEHNNVGTL